MSIDDNVGSLHRYLAQITTSKRYNNLRFKLYSILRKAHLVSDRGRGSILRFNNSLKALLSRQQNIFEGLNIRYFGPVDGHDIAGLVKVLGDIKDMTGPKILRRPKARDSKQPSRIRRHGTHPASSIPNQASALRASRARIRPNTRMCSGRRSSNSPKRTRK